MEKPKTGGAISPEVMGEVFTALRLVRKYSGQFAHDELEYAANLLGEELPYHPRPSQAFRRY